MEGKGTCGGNWVRKKGRGNKEIREGKGRGKARRGGLLALRGDDGCNKPS